MAGETHAAVPDGTAEELELVSAGVADSGSAPQRPTAMNDNGGDQPLAEVPVEPWAPVSAEQRRQLEARARIRMADPEYQRRIKATDALARSIIQGER